MNTRRSIESDLGCSKQAQALCHMCTQETELLDASLMHSLHHAPSLLRRRLCSVVETEHMIRGLVSLAESEFQDRSPGGAIQRKHLYEGILLFSYEADSDLSELIEFRT